MNTLFKLSAMLLVSFVLIFSSSCTKDNPGMDGKKTVKGQITNLDGAVENAFVYISFGATQITSNYDYVTVTDASGNYRFENLGIGSYYLDAQYENEYGFLFETQGVIIEINNNSEKDEIIVDMVLK